MPSSPDTARPAVRGATVVGAYLEAWRRVLRAPAIAIGLLGLTFLLVLPLAGVLRGMLQEQLGASRVADQAAVAWDAGWAAEFASEAQGVGRTLSHEILGFGGTVAIASAFADQTALNPTLASVIGAYIVLWMFLWGGILDRLARARRVGPGAFFGACGTFAGRFLRLAILTGAVWWMVLEVLHPLLFEDLYGRWVRDLAVESRAVMIRGGLYAVFLGTLALVGLVTDLARVRTVLEDRHSMLGAVVAAIRFVRRRPLRVLALYLLNLLVLAGCAAIWYAAAPAATAPAWLAFLLAQLYLLARVSTRLAAMASLVVFFQGELAHAAYTATPLPIWPDSPSVEALDNLTAGLRPPVGR